jgi:DhnA family fructose-bisphosphate aldolase class Ia
MITHFTKTANPAKGELELDATYDITQLKTRIANKLGAKTVKTAKTAAAAEVKWAAKTTFEYSVDPATYPVAGTNYGW